MTPFWNKTLKLKLKLPDLRPFTEMVDFFTRGQNVLYN